MLCQSATLCSPYATLYSPSAGETENKANSAQLELELGLSIATAGAGAWAEIGNKCEFKKNARNKDFWITGF